MGSDHRSRGSDRKRSRERSRDRSDRKRSDRRDDRDRHHRSDRRDDRDRHHRSDRREDRHRSDRHDRHDRRDDRGKDRIDRREITPPSLVPRAKTVKSNFSSTLFFTEFNFSPMAELVAFSFEVVFKNRQ